MVVLAVDNPGAWSQTEFESMLHDDDLQKVVPILDELGFVLVPEEPPWEPYDGVAHAAIFGEGRGTWWGRFFDYF